LEDKMSEEKKRIKSAVGKTQLYSPKNMGEDG
jgi:hypothetical protein